MRAIFLLLLAYLLSSPLLAQRGNPRVEYDGRSVDELVAEFMRDNDVPGMSLAIVQAPYITRATNYGVSDPSTRQLVAGHTVFDLREIAEAYTAVAIMQLVETGKIKLEDPIGKHLPQLPSACASITVRHILQHQSGLPDYPPGQGDPMARLAGLKPLFKPGTRKSPSATDHLLLMQLVAKVSGQSYQAFVRANQFEPLGLEHTFFASELPSIKREPLVPGQSHRDFLHQSVLIDPTEPARGNPGSAALPLRYSAGPTGGGNEFHPESAAIYSSASDVSFWDIGLAGDILIKDAQLRKMLYAPGQLLDATPVASSGPWDFPGWPGLMVVTGDSRGFSSLLSRFTNPADLVCVTLLANKEGLDLTQLARKIAGAYDPRLGPPTQTAAMRVQQSPHSVAETMARLERSLTASGVKVLTRIDHSQAANGVNLRLAPTQELIFGNPAAGTLLMQSNRAVAVDLPLRAVAWEENGAVWLAATDPVEICRQHGITEHAQLALRMRGAVDKALAEATAP